MSEATIEALESEALESETYESSEGEGEVITEALESEAFPGEASWAEAASDDPRRRRRRQIMMARQARQAQPRRPPAPARRAVVTVPSQRQAMAAIRSLDADTNMALRSLRRELEKAKRNGDLALYSATLSTLASQGLDTFEGGLKNHDVVRALVRTAPLALLWPQGARSGIGGVLLHPAFIGAAGVAAILVSGKLVNASEGVSSVIVSGPDRIIMGTGAKLNAIAVDRKGNEVASASFVWGSDNTSSAQVDSNGNVTGVTAGQATWITATSNGVTGRLWVKITEA